MHTVPSCGVTVCGRRWDELPLRVTTILSTLRDAHFITAHVHTTDLGAELISSASRKIHARSTLSRLSAMARAGATRDG